MSNTWDKLKILTTARVGLGCIGSSLPTSKVLEFQRAHASARSAVWLNWNYQELERQLVRLGESPLLLQSNAANREQYLRFPNKGRTLNTDIVIPIKKLETDIAFIISDGLSALAIQNHFYQFWNVFFPLFKQSIPELTYKIFLVPFARVAISDEIGELAKSKLSLIFLGERPGLNSFDSMGIYMTFNPRKGNSDAHRNCISNVRIPHGLNYQHASIKLIHLMNESIRLQISGVNLKDDLIITQIGTSTTSLK